MCTRRGCRSVVETRGRTRVGDRSTHGPRGRGACLVEGGPAGGVRGLVARHWWLRVMLEGVRWAQRGGVVGEAVWTWMEGGRRREEARRRTTCAGTTERERVGTGASLGWRCGRASLAGERGRAVSSEGEGRRLRRDEATTTTTTTPARPPSPPLEPLALRTAMFLVRLLCPPRCHRPS